MRTLINIYSYCCTGIKKQLVKRIWVPTKDVVTTAKDKSITLTEDGWEYVAFAVRNSTLLSPCHTRAWYCFSIVSEKERTELIAKKKVDIENIKEELKILEKYD